VFSRLKGRRRILSVEFEAENRPHGQEGYAVEEKVAGKDVQREVRSHLDAIVREGAERMLRVAIENEVAGFLDRHRDVVDEQGRREVVRNGYLPERTILTGAGPLEVRQPRVRDRRGTAHPDAVTFSSAILPPYLRRSKSLDELIPWLYLRGISTGDFQEALQALLGPNAQSLSATTVNRIVKVWEEEFEAWSRRDLSGKEYVYLYADGVYFRVRISGERQCILVVLGVTPEGKKELAGIREGYREDKQSWLELLLDLRSRGLTIDPKLSIADGGLGFWAALPEAYPTTRGQRCWVHKTANVLNKLPKSVQPRAKSGIHEIYMAETRGDAERAFDLFVEQFQAKYPKAVECLVKDRESLLAFYDFPAEHWVHIRSTNAIESIFDTVRHRHRKTKGSGSRTACLTMVFKLVQAAERKWRRITRAKLLLKLLAGYEYVDGIERERSAA
jgi:transposase-like protein